MVDFFRTTLIQPLFNLLVGIYNTVPGVDFGVAIIIVTVLVRLIFLPLSLKAQRSQKVITSLQPKLKELQEKHKGDREKLAKEQMDLYKQHNINPFSGCLPILIQLPVILALYRVVIRAFDPNSLTLLYGFVANPGVINNLSLGIIDLAERNPILAVITGLVQFVHSRLTIKHQQNSGTDQKSTTAQVGRQMAIMMPIMITFIAWSLPAGITLYILVSTVFTLLEHIYIHRRKAEVGVK